MKKRRYYIAILSNKEYVADCVEITKKAYKAFLEQGTKNLEKHRIKSNDGCVKPIEFTSMKDDIVRRYAYMTMGTTSLYVWEVTRSDD